MAASLSLRQMAELIDRKFAPAQPDLPAIPRNRAVWRVTLRVIGLYGFAAAPRPRHGLRRVTAHAGDDPARIHRQLC